MFRSSCFRSIALAFFFCLGQIVFAQTTVTVDGIVKDSEGKPVTGAYVLEKGTLNGTSSDIDGKYTLTVSANSAIAIQCLGYTTVEFKAEKSESKDIVLVEDALFLDDVVVVGYMSTTKRDMISSVSQVKTQEISKLPTTNISQGLAGRSPGLIVTQSGGGLNVNPTISIRGGGEPLYVIDGIIRTKADFTSLSPDDIEQMNILKDASATAIYGSRAANGIIQVVTKSGEKGKISVDYDFNQSFSQPAYWQERLNLWERYEYANQASLNDNLEPQYSQDVINLAKQGYDAQNRPMQNTRDYCTRNWAPQTKNTIRVYGGTDVAQTYASFSNVSQKTIFKNADNMFYKRNNIRIAETVNIKKAGLKIIASVDGYESDYSEAASTRDNGWGLFFSMIQNHGEGVYLNDLGLPWATGNQNIIGETSGDNGSNRTKTYVANAKGEVIWSIPWVKGLKLRASTNYRFYFMDNKNWKKDPAEYNWGSDVPVYPGQPSLQVTNDKNIGYTNNIFAEYGNTFGKHTFSVLAGYEQYYETSQDYWVKRTNYQFNVDQINIGPADTQTNGGWEAELGRAAWIGQAKYNYANKYYIEGSIRYDGSDYFAPGKRWGAFFGGSIGWVLTGEEWMKGVVEKNIFNMLKLRASYGQTGLDSSAGRFAYMQQYTLDAKGYVTDGAYTPTFNEGALPSSDLTWYTTNQTDIGFDFSSLKNRLYGSFDYFYYKTFGYLVSPTGVSYLNQIMGVGMPKVKSDSEFRREGIEVQLGWRDSAGDFTYDISGNITYFDQLWAYDQSEAESSYMNPYTRSQQNIGYYDVRYHNLGYYKDQNDVFNSVAYLGSMNTGWLAPGDIKYEDANGDGQITSADYRRVGKSSVPRCQFGLNLNFGFRGWYLSALFQGSSSYNKEIGGTNTMKTDQVGSLTTIYPYQTDTWTPTNTSAAYPRLMYNTNYNGNNNYLTSDFWLVNCAYLRFKDFQFGYDFKYAVLKNVKFISRLQIGISGQNIFTISDAKKYGLDPEASSAAGYGYPVERTLALTVNIGF